MTLHVYFGIKYHSDHRNKNFIELVCGILETNGSTVVCIARDVEKWGQIELAPSELMQISFNQIEAADVVLLDMTEKGVGLGIEAGYATARNKPIIVLLRHGSVLSTTMEGIASQIITYSTPEDLTIASLTFSN